jgi:phenylalanyl-tRNA synthetase beta chain
MPSGLKIEKRKIRGQTSNGMLCSARELGLGENHDGILALDLDVAPGTPFLRAVPAGDTRLEIDVLPNRPDLLSHAGVAREIGAALGLPVRLPEIPSPASDDASHAVPASESRLPAPRVRVDDKSVGRYVGAVVRGVRVGPSPAWLVERLAAIGARSINNVVDATNYVMHELGQPLHAFDLSRIRGGEVIVRAARTGETIVTLDGASRTLTTSMTVIADAEGAQAVAGVMGGQGSEVDESTTDLFLESASFDARRTRATRRALNLSTDASYRFERGVDPELARPALDRVVQVIVAVAGGRRDGDVVDLYPAPHTERVLLLRVARVAAMLGVFVPAEHIAALLQAIGFGIVTADDREHLRVSVPSWRADVTREADLVEEVARLRGYETFPSELTPFRPSAVPDAPMRAVADRVRDAMVARGLYEARPMPFVRGADLGFVRVTNPLAEDEAYLRRAVLDSLSRRVEYNFAHMQRNVRLFEIGSVFEPGAAGALPVERVHAAAVVVGDRRPAHFTEPRPPAYDEWDARGLAEALAAAAFPGRRTELEPGSGDTLWTVQIDDADAGVVRRLVLDAPVWAATAYGVEIDLGPALVDDVVAEPPAHARYRPLPTTPAAEFDLALLVPDGVPASRVESLLRSTAGDLLESVQLFDEFRGAGVPDGARSLAWHLTFRHPERTLRDKEIDGRRAKLVAALDSELGVRVRG